MTIKMTERELIATTAKLRLGGAKHITPATLWMWITNFSGEEMPGWDKHPKAKSKPNSTKN